MNIHNPNGVGTKNGTTAEACDYLDNVPNQTQCARENGSADFILDWRDIIISFNIIFECLSISLEIRKSVVKSCKRENY